MYYPFCSRGSHWIFCYVLLQQCFVLICQFFLLILLGKKENVSLPSMFYSVQISACWIIFHDHLLSSFSNHQKLVFFRKLCSISDSEHYLTNANPQMIMKTDILDYKNCTCIMISKKVETFIFNPLLLFSRFRFAHKAMRKKKKKKKNHNFEYSVIQDFV